jgi:hypothetical protein
MDTKALNDLEKKIRNVCRDFELEHDALTGNTINVRVAVENGVIMVRQVAAGGPVTAGLNYVVGEGTEMYKVGRVNTADLAQQGDTEREADSTFATYDPIHYADVEANGKKRSWDLPRLDDHTSDTDQMTVSPTLLNAHLPVEEMLTEREREDYHRHTDPVLPSVSTGPQSYVYEDAPGMIFESPEQHQIWQRAQTRKGRNAPNSTIPKPIDPNTSTI